MSFGDIIIIVAVVVIGIVAVLYFLNRWASKKTVEHNSIVDRTRQSVEIFVIDKKMGKLSEANLPKSALEQVPKIHKVMKTPLVKAKIGPQIMTLMCDKRIFNALPVKKSVKIDLAGIYIVDIKGMKNAGEQKASAKAKKENANQTKKGKN
ncbi:MAG: hypothetical protein FWE29_03190 [Defluviitaleaceae bacterium]|nr:hypothetical protein [Defluviitaleaceae bacterium]